MVCRITREKNYPSKAHPGPAWVWLYKITGPDGQTFSGTGIGWAERLCKRKYPASAIVKDWIVERSLSA